ncbi:hypothetical protein [Methylobacterium radiotolerans]|uniref:Uncharacterized protein n=1 Tax=Methylobacterium radiotolerans (strain ATCC 27329 / DSM 1819 / JCM 2831 / NBRC 15690 / NCIMB 10815 / 0-1) TaxID=426355 RepID=B1LXC0_METRJ|nr:MULTISPECIES: hypothetical protein [Methylobacterium]ACB27241.1 hypothetical protein Mrad2831_5294 [Methylobacterium radiotolerans JCM 2831]GEM98263.1 hypothetical protein MRA01_28030 [Methylobacterium radiotolerans]
MLPISRYLATHLVLSSKLFILADGKPIAAGDRVDAKAVRLALAVLSRAAARQVDRGEWLDARWDHEHLSGRPRETVTVPLARLRVDLGKVTLGGLVEAHGRAANIQASILGEPGFGEHPILDAGVHAQAGQTKHRIAKATNTVDFRVDRTLAAVAHLYADANDDELDPRPFGYDPTVMAAFSCRYSPLAYLRVLAWTEDGARLPRGWRARRVRGGLLSVEIPVPEVQQALGATGMPNASAIEAQLIRPVAEDLRRVGMTVDWGWERSPKMKGPRALVLRVSDPREACAPARTRTPTAMRRPRPRPAPSGLRALRPQIPACR